MASKSDPSAWESLWRSPPASSQLSGGSRCRVAFHPLANCMVLQQFSEEAAILRPLSLLLAWQSEETSHQSCSVVHTGLEYWAGQGDV